QRLENVVGADLDVGRHQSSDARIGPAEYHVLAGRLQEIVGGLEGAGAGPPGDRLRIRAGFLEIGQVRIDDRRGARNHRRPPTGSRVMTSPGCARSGAAWRSPPAETERVRPAGAVGVVSTRRRGSSGCPAVGASAPAWATRTSATASALVVVRPARPRLMLSPCLVATYASPGAG